VDIPFFEILFLNPIAEVKEMQNAETVQGFLLSRKPNTWQSV